MKAWVYQEARRAKEIGPELHHSLSGGSILPANAAARAAAPAPGGREPLKGSKTKSKQS